MTAQHTPGPWRYTDGGIIDNGSAPTQTSDYREIADVYGTEEFDARPLVPDQSEANVNARLVTAAPELLAIAVYLSEFFNAGKSVGASSLVDETTTIAEAVRQAIAKITN